jgi:phage terminase small subunit
MSLTPEQRTALDALPPKRRAFVLAYCGEAAGNAAEAARKAGYRGDSRREGSRLLTHADVRAAVEAMRTPALAEQVSVIAELRAMWASIARGEIDDVAIIGGGPVNVPASLAVRMKATELLGKSEGAFLERREVSGPNGAAVVVKLTTDEARRLAKGSDE